MSGDISLAMQTLTKLGAKVIARNGAKALGDEWNHDVKEEPSVGLKTGEPIKTYTPVAHHKSGLIGLHYLPGTGWSSAIGLQSSLMEGEKKMPTNFLIKAYSDWNAAPRRAVIEVINRTRRLVQALGPQLGQLDGIYRSTVRLENPKVPVEDPLTFDQWWEKSGNGCLPHDREIARLAWEASKANL